MYIDYRRKIADAVENLMPNLWELALYLHEHPEVSGAEYNAQKVLVDFLTQQDFECSLGVADIPTSFSSVIKPLARPTIAFIAEYDALPGLGHGCGHNLIAASAVGSASALKRAFPELARHVMVLGTPAEETPDLCVKQVMLERGAFEGASVVLMMHPSDRTTSMSRSLAADSITFRFKGKPAHASKYPHLGVSALDAALLTVVATEFLREHVPPDVRIHGIIREGGLRPNVVPERAVLEYIIRAETRMVLDCIRDRIINCARAACLATGAEVETVYKRGPDSKLLVPSLNAALLEEAIAAGAEQVLEPEKELGSTDFGNVSQCFPSAVLKVAFVPVGCPSHSYQWVEASRGERARHALSVACRAMACTAYRLVNHKELLARVLKEFEEMKISTNNGTIFHLNGKEVKYE